jgi:uncharacterized membrane protein
VTTACIVRHLSFRSGGYDLGIFDQGIWLLGHSDEPFSTIRGRNLFADHFQPALVLLAPLGTLSLNPWGVLVLQSALLAAAAPFLYLLALARGADRWLAAAVGLLWLASPLTQWANLFDYHPETAVPLLFAAGALLLERDRDWWFVATAVLASSIKEDICLVYVLWGVALALGGRVRFGLALSAVSALWFVLATKVAIPAAGGDLDFYSARFAGDRGSSVGEVLLSAVRDPVAALDDASTPANLKILLALVLCSGGLALLAPRMLLPALAPLIANVLSAYSYQHELRFHYQLIPAAVFAVASAYGAGVLTRLVEPRVRSAAAVVLISGAVVVGLPLSRAVDELRQDERPSADAKRHALELIPEHASVAAAPDVVPHLAQRRLVYQLPEPFFTRPTNGETWSDAELARRAREVEYVLYDVEALDPFPRTQAEQLPAMLPRQGFRQIFREGDVRVYRRVRRL